MKRELIKIAILDLYNNEANHGIRCIKDLIGLCQQQVPEKILNYDIFETRYKADVPGMEYDIYISSGGPGSPFDGEGTVWESRYFQLIDRIWNHNRQNQPSQKYVFFICHSFQMMCRFFNLATVRRRSQRSFGILPVYKTDSADHDFLLRGLPQTYYAADFRYFEAVQPNESVFKELDAKIISREAQRIDPTLEQALMAIRVSDEFVGTQYHPEADPVSMLYYFQQPDWKKQVVDEHGEEKYKEMIAHLEEPENIMLTRRTVLPGFLLNAIENLSQQKFARESSFIDEKNAAPLV